MFANKKIAARSNKKNTLESMPGYFSIIRAITASLLFCSISVVCHANNVPVVNLTQGYEDNTNTSSMPLSDRVSRLEQQVNNLIQMNLPQEIAELQQQVEKLNGQLQEQAHQLDVLGRTQQHVEALPPASPATPPIQAVPISPVSEAPVAPPNTTAPPTNIPPQTDTAAYEAAFNLLATKQWDQATLAFQRYLKEHPDGQYAANAHYWLGDLYLKQRNLTQGELELNLVVTQYPSSSKVADAQLKLAILHAQQGKTEQANQELKNIILRYPGSTAAQVAAMQLQQLNAPTRSNP